jgi:hypothetical protein
VGHDPYAAGGAAGLLVAQALEPSLIYIYEDTICTDRGKRAFASRRIPKTTCQESR